MAATLSPSLPEKEELSSDNRMVAVVRLMLAIGALIIILVDPTEPKHYVEQTYSALILYVLFSFIVYLVARSEKVFISCSLSNPYWADMGFYFLLVFLTGGTTSIFFFFFFFVILNASFMGGFRTGITAALLSAGGFTILSLVSPTDGDFQLDRFLMRPMSLGGLGYMFARWGGNQKRNIRRLRLLREMGQLSNPRFGVDRTVGVNINLLRTFFDADTCILVSGVLGGERFRIRTCHDKNPEGAITQNELEREIAESLLVLPDHQAAYLETGTLPQLRNSRPFIVFDCDLGRPVKTSIEPFKELAETLGAVSYITAPLKNHGKWAARIFLHSQRNFVFDRSDVEFLLQALDHFSPIVENISLVDRMASDAAEEERKKIARDIHDSIIQPYIGLQLGLDSLVEMMGDGDTLDVGKQTLVKNRVRRLREMTDEGIVDLRSYVAGLSVTGSTENSLFQAVERYAAKFKVATGIDVELDLQTGVRVSDRLAAEVFQIIAEGLSNIRRHTESPVAKISIRVADNRLLLTLANISGENVFAPFTPVSITNRSRSLGGSLQVQTEGALTVLGIQIPM